MSDYYQSGFYALLLIRYRLLRLLLCFVGILLSNKFNTKFVGKFYCFGLIVLTCGPFTPGSPGFPFSPSEPCWNKAINRKSRLQQVRTIEGSLFIDNTSDFPKHRKERFLSYLKD